MLLEKMGHPSEQFLARFASPATLAFVARFQVPHYLVARTAFDVVRSMSVPRRCPCSSGRSTSRCSRSSSTCSNSVRLHVRRARHVPADPDERGSAADALELPLFAAYHHPDHEPVCGPIDASFEQEHSLAEWREMTFREIQDFQAAHPDA